MQLKCPTALRCCSKSEKLTISCHDRSLSLLQTAELNVFFVRSSLRTTGVFFRGAAISSRAWTLSNVGFCLNSSRLPSFNNVQDMLCKSALLAMTHVKFSGRHRTLSPCHGNLPNRKKTIFYETEHLSTKRNRESR